MAIWTPTGVLPAFAMLQNAGAAQRTAHSQGALLTIVVVVAAVLAFAGAALYGAWIDGRRQRVRDKGLHPVTTPEGQVKAREQEHGGEDDQG